MELKDKLQLLKFKIQTYYEGIEKCNTEIAQIEKELYGTSRMITANNIINEVAMKYGIGNWEITSKSRRKEIVEARREVCMRLKEMNYTLQRIGDILGGFNHTSIMYLLKTSKENVKKAPLIGGF